MTKVRSTLVNRPIASLFNGVSQQPASLRLSSQCKLQENAYTNLVDGLSKRPPTEHIDQLNTNTNEDRFIHWIDRDDTEQYILVMQDQEIKLYALDGTEQTVNVIAPATLGYLDIGAAAARSSFAAVTIADFTFIVNKTVTCAMDAAVLPGSITGTKQTFGDLPAGSTGEIYEISGDPTNEFDNFYAEKQASGVWLETGKPGETFSFDYATVPHELVRVSAGVFEFRQVSWTDRVVGEKATNPDPSFIGNTINDIFLHNNRLGFLTGENVVLSSVPSSDFFFYRDSMVALTDSDPIDTAASENSVATLFHAVPFDKSLMLFSEKAQFILTANGALTPTTAALDVSTRFESDNSVKPVGAGPNVYFGVPRGEYTGIREYFVQEDSFVNDAADVTAHVPDYVPKNLTVLASSSNEDLLLASSAEERNAIYVYKYFWQGDEKVQSSWSKWTFSSGDKILGMEVYETDLYLAIQRTDGLYLEKLVIKNLQPDTGLNHAVLLDRKTSLTGAYDAGNGWTTWTLPYDESGDVEVVLGGTYTGKEGQKLGSLTRPSNTTVRRTGDYSASPAWVGRPYTLRYRFSEQFIKDASSNTVRDAKLMMKYWEVNFTRSAYFRAEVTPKARDMYSYVWTSNTVGDAASLLGPLILRDGSFKFPVQSDSRTVQIDLVNDQPVPCIFQSAEWRALFSARSRR